MFVVLLTFVRITASRSLSATAPSIVGGDNSRTSAFPTCEFHFSVRP
jgi:hypothetical protein